MPNNLVSPPYNISLTHSKNNKRFGWLVEHLTEHINNNFVNKNCVIDKLLAIHSLHRNVTIIISILYIEDVLYYSIFNKYECNVSV